jgi:hypothetical protein
MTKSFIGRSFKLWEYRVSHGMLLLRSPKGTPIPERNVDIMLAGVDYMDLPADCRTLEIEEASSADVAFAESRMGKPVAQKKVFVFNCDSRRHVVIAVGIKVAETDMDIFETPFK